MAIPIVRAVGGLNGSVEDYDVEKATGSGFVFAPYTPERYARPWNELCICSRTKKLDALMQGAMKIITLGPLGGAYARVYEQARE